MADVQTASDAIGTFLTATGEIDCPNPGTVDQRGSGDANAGAHTDARADAGTDPGAHHRAHARADGGADPGADCGAHGGADQFTAEPTEEETAEPTAEPTATPSSEPTPTLSESPSASPSASASASPSASPAPEPTDSGTGGLLPWVIGIGLFGTGVAAIYAWYRSTRCSRRPTMAWDLTASRCPTAEGPWRTQRPALVRELPLPLAPLARHRPA